MIFRALKTPVEIIGVLVFLALMLPPPLLGANHYIWCGATGPGTGADWSNAWPDISVMNGTITGVAGSGTVTFTTPLGTTLPGSFQTGTFVSLDNGATIEDGVVNGFWNQTQINQSSISNVTSISFQFSIGHRVMTSFTSTEVTASAELIRGDTYYFAGSSSCTYAPHVFQDADSGTATITLLKATQANAGSVAGWQSSFGTNPAEFTDATTPAGTTPVYSPTGSPAAPIITFIPGGTIPNSTMVTVQVTYKNVQGESTPSTATIMTTSTSGPYNLVVASPALAGDAYSYFVYACTGMSCTPTRQGTNPFLLNNDGIASITTTGAQLPTADLTGGETFLWALGTDSYTFDGQTGTGNQAGQFGFLLRSASPFSSGTVSLNANPNLTFLTFNHVEIDGINCCNNGPLTNDRYTWKFSAGNYSNLSFSNDYSHDIGGAPFRVGNMANMTMDHCWMARTSTSTISGGFLHGEGVFLGVGVSTVDTNVTFSNDVWEDVTGTGVIVLGNGHITGVYIYNNIFFQVSNAPLPIADTNYVGDGVLSDLGAALSLVRVYNNTFYNTTGASSGGVSFNATSTNFNTPNDIDIQNNLLYNVSAPSLLPNGKHTFNTLINSPPENGTIYGPTETVPASVIPLTSETISGSTVTATNRGNNGLSNGTPVAVLRTFFSGQQQCPYDTRPVYPTAFSVTATQFSYTTQNSGSFNCTSGNVIPAAPVVFVKPPVAGEANDFNLDFHLVSDTIVAGLNTGNNLTSICSSLGIACNMDNSGAMRPLTGNWDVGAFQIVGPPPGPASNLMLTPH